MVWVGRFSWVAASQKVQLVTDCFARVPGERSHEREDASALHPGRHPLSGQLRRRLPDQLSRVLVLVKWWLLAIPHYLIIGLFTSGLVWWTTQLNQEGNAAPNAAA
jgi:hypothetical protein